MWRWHAKDNGRMAKRGRNRGCALCAHGVSRTGSHGLRSLKAELKGCRLLDVGDRLVDEGRQHPLRLGLLDDLHAVRHVDVRQRRGQQGSDAESVRFLVFAIIYAYIGRSGSVRCT